MSNQQSSQSSPGIEDINPNINLDFEKNSSFQEGVMSETFQRLDKSFFQEPEELEDLINKGNLIQKFLPKQADIDKILKVIQRKVLKGTYLLVDIQEIKPDTYIALILRTYTYHTIIYHLPKWQLEK